MIKTFILFIVNEKQPHKYRPKSSHRHEKLFDLKQKPIEVSFIVICFSLVKTHHSHNTVPERISKRPFTVFQVNR